MSLSAKSMNPSYEEIHEILHDLSTQIRNRYNPDVIVAIGGGGLIPARILRTYLNKPVYVVSTVAYSNDELLDAVLCLQWVYTDFMDKKILLVDEVDDSGTTLKFCLEKLIKDNRASSISLCVLHRKLKAKKYNLSEYPEIYTYFHGCEVSDVWINYPWDRQNPYQQNCITYPDADSSIIQMEPIEEDIMTEQTEQTNQTKQKEYGVLGETVIRLPEGVEDEATPQSKNHSRSTRPPLFSYFASVFSQLVGNNFDVNES